MGLLEEAEIRSAETRLEAEDAALRAAESTTLSPEQANPLLESAGSTPISEPIRIRELCRRPGVTLASLLTATGSDANAEHAEWADIEIKYEGYVIRERDAAARLAELDEVPLPAALEYHTIQTISWEAREKLAAVQPTSIGQAGRVPGVSPADLQNLAFAVLRRRT